MFPISCNMPFNYKIHPRPESECMFEQAIHSMFSVGVDELEPSKLTPLWRLKCHDSLADAVADLSKPEEISLVFLGFQRYLYQQTA